MHYNWQNSNSALKDIEIYRPHNKQEAVLFAPVDLPPEKLQEIPEKLKKYNLVAEPDMQGGAYVLRVKNFGSAKRLLDILSKEALVEGIPAVTKTELDKKSQGSISTVRLAGAIHFCTDVSLMVAGWMRGKTGMGDTLAGMKWAGVGLMLAVFGSKDPDKQVGYIYKDAPDNLKKAGANLTAEDIAILKGLSEKSGLLPTVERAIRENPILINNVITAWGGLDMIRAGYDQKSLKTGEPNHYKMIAGTLTAVGQSAGIMIEPKKKKPQDEEVEKDENGKPKKKKKEDPRNVFDKVEDFYEGKPLRITGQASILSNVFRMISGWTEMAENNHFLNVEYPQSKADIAQYGDNPLARRKMTVLDDKRATYSKKVTSAKIDLGANVAKMVANGCYALSDTNIDADLKKLGLLDEIGNTVAHVIFHQPEAERPKMVEDMSKVLARQCGGKVTQKDMAEAIGRKLDAITKNPWEKSYVPTVQVNNVTGHAPLEAPSLGAEIS